MDRRNGSGGVIKKRSSSGCLIIKRNIDNRSSAGASSGLFISNNEKRSYRLMESDGDNRANFSHQVSCNEPVGVNRKFFLEEDEAHKQKVGEVIRVQGKNGVLKIMVNKRRRMDLPPHLRYERTEATDIGTSRLEDCVKVDFPRSAGSFSPAIRGVLKDKDGKLVEEGGAKYKKSKIDGRRRIHGRNMSRKAVDMETDGTGTALTLGLPGVQVLHVKREMAEEGTPAFENAQRSKTKDFTETKSKRVGSTEKQILREKIRGMLVDAGWKIDHRPRRNRDYLDAVYINPNGTAYWSIIKAYDALKKQLQQDKASGKPVVPSLSFSSLPEDLLNKLTRQTKKKVREELKRKSKEDNLTVFGRGHGFGDDGESSDSDHKYEKLARSKAWNHLSGISEPEEKYQDRNADLSKHSSPVKSAEVLAEKTSVASTSSLLQIKTSKKSNGIFQPRPSVRGLNPGPNGCAPHMAKRTILAWLIDSGTVQLGEKVQYMNHKTSRVMLEGWITREGIYCGCCSKILSISKFELHSQSKVRQPWQNIFLESGSSLLNCQLDAWNKQAGSATSGFHNISVDSQDSENDICDVCGDDGALISCSNCLSTFHQPCLGTKILTGDWKCRNCICKFCGGDIAEYDDNELISCAFCHESYHKSSCCTYSPPSSNGVYFCRHKCQELYDQLLKILGVKHELEAGYSWSFLQQAPVYEVSNSTLPQRVECNSKLAVALSILDECFSPIIDRRSGVNILQSAVYSIRSNLSRLNCQGFFTATLEREDEIVSAACLRMHGSRLVEMPFVATREIYRRQGMCHRLLAAIERELLRFGVEHMIIPALPEQMGMWTRAFGFRKLEDALRKEMKTINILVFPDMHFLQKDLLKQDLSYGIKQTKTIADHRGKVSDCSTANASGSVSSSGSESFSTGSEAACAMPRTGNNVTLGLKDNPDSATESSSADTEDADTL